MVLSHKTQRTAVLFRGFMKKCENSPKNLHNLRRRCIMGQNRDADFTLKMVSRLSRSEDALTPHPTHTRHLPHPRLFSCDFTRVHGEGLRSALLDASGMDSADCFLLYGSIFRLHHSKGSLHMIHNTGNSVSLPHAVTENHSRMNAAGEGGAKRRMRRADPCKSRKSPLPQPQSRQERTLS